MLRVLVACFTLFFMSCAEDNGLADFKWIIGHWNYKELNPPAIEQWSMEGGDMLVGKGSVIVDGDTILVEDMRISKTEEGLKLSLKTMPDGEIVLNIISCDEDSIVFENEDIDFPKKMIYKKIGEHQRETMVSGKLNGQDTTLTFHLERKL